MEHEQQPDQPTNEATESLAASGATPAEPEREQLPGETPELYIASLADYNAGRLHGIWVDASADVEDIQSEIRTMLSRSPELRTEGEDYGDWAIHDYQGFGVAQVHEHDDLDVVHALAVGIQAHGEAFSAWADVNDDDRARWELFEEAYLGEYDSVAAYGEQIIEEMGWQDEIDRVLPESVSRYVRIDGDALAQDMWLSGEMQVVHSPNGGVWVFLGEV